MPALYSFYVINKSGGMIYQKVRSKRRVVKVAQHERHLISTHQLGLCQVARARVHRHQRQDAPGQYLVCRMDTQAAVLANPIQRVADAIQSTSTTRPYAHYRHSINEIASQLSPAPQCTGIEMLQADTFDVHCFQTLTGTKFVMVAERHTPDVDELLRTTYVEIGMYARVGKNVGDVGVTVLGVVCLPMHTYTHLRTPTHTSTTFQDLRFVHRLCVEKPFL